MITGAGRMEKKSIAILGSTGSIGVQTLEVIEKHSQLFDVEIITADSNVDLLISQARKFKPNAVVITNDDHYSYLKEALDPIGIKVYAGADALEQIVQMDTIDMVLTAIVGFAGLAPTIQAIKAGKPIALANKETLVVAGELVMKMALENRVPIIPVDSEHSAIFQCLVGEDHNPVERIILTASGGPFRTKTRKEIESVSLKEALNHPNWSMGSKITIDSATLMNKGLEIIEAKWLFGVSHNQIDVVVHPQSIIHSLVEFQDGSLKAQLGLPDMRLPIQYALGFPQRLPNLHKRLSFADYPELNFESPDPERFPNLRIARECLQKGGNWPCIMNAANEIAVGAFLKEKIRFIDIPVLIEKTLEKSSFVKSPDYPEYLESDREARKLTLSFIN